MLRSSAPCSLAPLTVCGSCPGNWQPCSGFAVLPNIFFRKYQPSLCSVPPRKWFFPSKYSHICLLTSLKVTSLFCFQDCLCCLLKFPLLFQKNSAHRSSMLRASPCSSAHSGQRLSLTGHSDGSQQGHGCPLLNSGSVLFPYLPHHLRMFWISSSSGFCDNRFTRFPRGCTFSLFWLLLSPQNRSPPGYWHL